MLQNDFKLDRDSSVSRRTVDNKEESSGRNENCSTGSVYSGDLVVYKCKQPWDWTPAYGTVVNLPPNASREKPSTSEARTEGPDDSPKGMLTKLSLPETTDYNFPRRFGFSRFQ